MEERSRGCFGSGGLGLGWNEVRCAKCASCSKLECWGRPGLVERLDMALEDLMDWG